MASEPIREHRWIYFDYQGGWVGVRIEPENQVRADAMKTLIPKEERWYKSEERKWLFRPRWCAEVVHLLREYCPEYPVIFEEENSELLASLLLGPRYYFKQVALPMVPAIPTEPPVGKVFGRIASLPA